MSNGGRRPRRKGTNFETVQWGLDKHEVKVGPWFIAEYSSTLSCCGDKCEDGDEIRADGEGGYQGRCCYPEKDD